MTDQSCCSNPWSRPKSHLRLDERGACVPKMQVKGCVILWEQKHRRPCHSCQRSSHTTRNNHNPTATRSTNSHPSALAFFGAVQVMTIRHILRCFRNTCNQERKVRVSVVWSVFEQNNCLWFRFASFPSIPRSSCPNTHTLSFLHTYSHSLTHSLSHSHHTFTLTHRLHRLNACFERWLLSWTS